MPRSKSIGHTNHQMTRSKWKKLCTFKNMAYAMSVEKE